MARSGWTLLQDAEAYETYKRRICAARNWDITQVDWGQAPEAFPSLVASHCPAFNRVVSAFVHVEHAVDLLVAAGLPFDEVVLHNFRGARKLSEDVVVPTAAAVLQHTASGKAGQAQSTTAMLSGQAVFNISMTAHVLSIVQTLIQGRMIDEQKYEQRYQANLAAADRWATAPGQRAKINSAIEGAEQVFPTLIKDKPDSNNGI